MSYYRVVIISNSRSNCQQAHVCVCVCVCSRAYDNSRTQDKIQVKIYESQIFQSNANAFFPLKYLNVFQLLS